MEQARASRITQYAPRIVPWIALGLILLTSAIDFSNRWASVVDTLPIVRLLSEPDEQYRVQLGSVPYDLLREADRIMPRDAVVLLVTQGRDTGRLEYTTYHRALYFLAPRPVWWAAPTPSDGTWKSRWWIPTPITGESLSALAAGKRASYLLAFGVSTPLPIGRIVLQRGDGFLLQLDGAPSPQDSIPQQTRYASTAWPLQLSVAIAIALALGSMALHGAARLGLQTSGAEALALVWPLGAGLLTLLMLLLGTLGFSLGWQMALLALLAAGWAAYRAPSWAARRFAPFGMQGVKRALKVRDRREEGQPAGGSLPLRLALPIQALLILFFALQLLLVAVSALGRPLAVWDSWVNWGVKSRSIFLEGHISSAVYADPSHAVTHLDYPLQAPLLQTWFYGWLGAPDDRFAGVASVLFYLALAGVCYTTVRGRRERNDEPRSEATIPHSALRTPHSTLRIPHWRGGRTLALAAAVGVATMPNLAGLAGIVFAETPLVVYATIAGVYLFRWLEGGPPGTLVIVALSAGLLLWTKRDGVLFLAALLLATLLLGARSRRARQGIAALALAALVMSGPWYIFAALQGVASPDFSPVSLTLLLENWARWDTIAELEWNSLVSPNWSYLWPMAALVGLVFWVKKHKAVLSYAALFPLAALIYLPLAGSVYFFSDFVPYEGHILSSIDRLLAQPTPLIVLWVALYAITHET